MDNTGAAGRRARTQSPPVMAAPGPLHDVRVCVTGFDLARRDALRDLVEASGGDFNGELRKAWTTHLVAAEDGWRESKKYIAAVKWLMAVVDEYWLMDSCHLQSLQPVEDYRIELPFHERDRRRRLKHMFANANQIPDPPTLVLDDEDAASTPIKPEPVSMVKHEEVKEHENDDRQRVLTNNAGIDLSHSFAQASPATNTHSRAVLHSNHLVTPNNQRANERSMASMMEKSYQSVADAGNHSRPSSKQLWSEDLFESIQLHFIGFDDNNTSYCEALRLFLRHGGTRFREYRAAVTHMVAPSRAVIDDAVTAGRLPSALRAKLVRTDWIADSVHSLTLATESDYALPATQPAESLPRSSLMMETESIVPYVTVESRALSNVSNGAKERNTENANVKTKSTAVSANGTSKGVPPTHPSARSSSRVTAQSSPASSPTGIFRRCAFKFVDLNLPQTLQLVAIVRDCGGHLFEEDSTGELFVVAPHYTPSLANHQPTQSPPSACHFVTPYYVKQCKEFKQRVKVRHSALYRPLPKPDALRKVPDYSLVVATFSGFGSDDLEEKRLLSSLIVAMGGRVTDGLNQVNTHLVANAPNSASAKWTEAKKRAIKIVTKRWICECAIQQQRLAENSFLWSEDSDIWQKTDTDEREDETDLMKEYAAMDDDDDEQPKPVSSVIQRSAPEDAMAVVIDISHRESNDVSNDNPAASPVTPAVLTNYRNRVYVALGSESSVPHTPSSRSSLGRKRRAEWKAETDGNAIHTVAEAGPFSFDGDDGKSITPAPAPVANNKVPVNRTLVRTSDDLPAAAKHEKTVFADATSQAKDESSATVVAAAPTFAPPPAPTAAAKPAAATMPKLMINSDAAIAAAAKARSTRSNARAPAVFRQFQEKLGDERKAKSARSQSKDSEANLALEERANEDAPLLTVAAVDENPGKRNRKRRALTPPPPPDDESEDCSEQSETPTANDSVELAASTRSSRSKRKAVVKPSSKRQRNTSVSVIDVSMTESPLPRRTRQNRNYVLALSNFHESKRPNYVSRVEKLGGRVLRDDEEMTECTHLVLAGNVKRSARVMTAIVSGLPLISHDWIDDSAKAGVFKDIADYEFKSSHRDAGKIPGSLLDAITRWRHRRPFEGRSFHVHCSEQTGLVLERVIQAGGGIIRAEDELRDTSDDSDSELIALIIEREDDRRSIQLMDRFPDLPAYRSVYIFDFIAPKDDTVEFHPNDYRLNPVVKVEPVVVAKAKPSTRRSSKRGSKGS